MKQIHFFLIVIFFAVSSFGFINKNSFRNNEHNNQAIKFKRYGIKSGVVEYESTGSVTGSTILYFDDWGYKEAKFEKTEMKMMGISVKENKVTIIDGEWTYNINLDQNTGTKIKTPLIEQIVENSGNEDLTDFGEQLMKNMGGKITGKESVLGKQCDIWEIKNLGSKIYVWNWVPLKSDVNFMGQKITQIVSKFDENAEIPSEKLKIPSGVTITDGVDLNSILNKMKSGKKK